MIRYCSRECQKSHWKEEHKKDCKVFAMAYSATSDDQLPLDRTDRILARQQLSDRILARQQRGMRYSQKGDLDAAEADFRSIIEVERCYTITNFSNLEG